MTMGMAWVSLKLEMNTGEFRMFEEQSSSVVVGE